MDARTRRKLKRKAERELKEQGIDASTVWFAMEPRKEEWPGKLVPGKDFYVETPEAQARMDSNSWDENFDEVIDFIKKASIDLMDRYESDRNTLKPGIIDWSWVRNMDCKYINIRIDMRDGGFILINDKKERISLDALKWQYRYEEKCQKTNQK